MQRAKMEARRLLMRAVYRAFYLSSRQARDGGITILSYHSLDNHGTPLSVPPRLFEAQMRALAAERCPTFTMAQVGEYLAARRPFPPRSMAITFDDGFANLATAGAPVLTRYELRATAYIISGMVGRATEWTDRGKQLPSMPLLNWEQIDELRRQGIEIGAHSVTHGFLTQYAPGELDNELRGSKQAIERRLGSAIRSFAYPQGDYDDRVVAATRAAGYETATTVDQGRARAGSDPLRLPRLLVSGNTSPDVMRAFSVAGIGPAYSLINFAFKRVLGRNNWPRRRPGEIDSTGSVPMGEIQ